MSMISSQFRKAALAAVSLVVLSGAAAAQDSRSSGGLLDNLFSRGEPPARSTRAQAEPSDDGELSTRIDRLENALRQLTGQIEQLQYRNQQLEQQLSRLGAAPPPSSAPAPVTNAMPPAAQPLPPTVRPGSSPTALPRENANGRRSDVFDPSQNPAAPGAPRALGSPDSAAPPPVAVQEQPDVGAPGGRAAGAPLDLSSVGQPGQPAPGENGALPPPPPRNVSATGAQVATLPPTQSPKDEYDLAYGYVLHKDYALAENAFRGFLSKNPRDALVPDAQYWLGESLFQRQRYQDAADSFLIVVRNHEKSGKAPDALLRLGQSLHALGQKEMACASLGEVGHKYPNASASVKRSVTQEQKRAHC